jgi:hypothetical protein
MRSRLFGPIHYLKSAETGSREECWVKLSLCTSLEAASTICRNFVQRTSRFGGSNTRDLVCDDSPKGITRKKINVAVRLRTDLRKRGLNIVSKLPPLRIISRHEGYWVTTKRISLAKVARNRAKAVGIVGIEARMPGHLLVCLAGLLWRINLLSPCLARTRKARLRRSLPVRFRQVKLAQSSSRSVPTLIPSILRKKWKIDAGQSNRTLICNIVSLDVH